MASQGQQEPVMEDVLASIKKILSEDDDSVKTENEESAVSSISSNLGQVDTKKDNLTIDEANEAVDEANEAVDNSIESEILVSNEEDNTFLSEDGPDLSEEEKLEENDLSNDDQDEVGQEIAQDLIDKENINKVEDLSAVSQPAETPVLPHKAEFKVTGKESLVAEKVKDMSGKHFSDLAKVVAEERSISLGNHGLSLEELVREILNPILKDWLDQNLPHMVERIVKQEIELIVNRSERLDE